MNTINISELKRFEMPQCGVYFLFKGDKLQYIGKSIHIFDRIKTHMQYKDFDNYAFIKCESEDESFKLERECIVAYQPECNNQLKREYLKGCIIDSLQMVEKLNKLIEVSKIELAKCQ